MDLYSICKTIPDYMKLVVRDSCFKIELSDKVLAEICCNGMQYPLDGYERLSVIVSPSSSYTIFDNKIGLVPNTSGTDSIYRGVVLCIEYPCTDSYGESVLDVDKNAIIRFTNLIGGTFDIPIYNHFNALCNPNTTDLSNAINKIEIVNPNPFQVTASALVVRSSSTGVKLSSKKTC
jgi:hypothetical protein